jgi:hypothetical protein
MTETTKNLNTYLTNNAPDLVPHETSREAWWDFRADRGYHTIKARYLSEPNQKIAKNRIPTISFTGAPHRMSGLNACTNSTKTCRQVCIRYTGRLEMPYAMSVGIDRMEFLRLKPSEACSLIHWETTLAAGRTEQLGRRLNVVTDIRWPDHAGWLFTEAPDNVVTYDYTKHWDRDEWPTDRYRLTFSATERHNVDDIREKTATGACVAVVFPAEHKETGYPDAWHGIPVIDGDITDFRYEDPAGCIVALYAKGRARKLPTGTGRFVKTMEAF